MKKQEDRRINIMTHTKHVTNNEGLFLGPVVVEPWVTGQIPTQFVSNNMSRRTHRYQWHAANGG